MEKDTQEYLILKSIHDGEETIKQRDIAKIANISLGNTNSILKRLIDKGFVKASHINQKSFNYLLTPKGLSVITKRSSDFLKRTIRNVVVFKDAIELIVKDIKDNNFKSINLIGESDLLFLIENSCYKHQLKLTTTNKEITDPTVKNIYSESFLPKEENSSNIYLIDSLDEATRTICDY
ncbi:winged helix-turn-helix transcriptional regulator [Thiospirochaeta perfilievii]|uniref:Winged helix-turn-helix transcriptional regulator n=1 Tax=Thiospirochaeta perfilievii TaxID=252967 RepID=A0A5C1QEV6_9SPIO|nr:winged helix-turn-helix transcriptional regulator [Thiospirochaeta perfilievii]QEN05610.1 winged helix-turn-helix transcriptional regulator [Thiospirochaeta perfilievii]